MVVEVEPSGSAARRTLKPTTSSSRTRKTIITSTGSSARGAEWFCGEKDFETDYIKLKNKKDDHYFYWFISSRSSTSSTDPLVIWLNGGLGTSSLQGLLTANGPCLLDTHAKGKPNQYAWTNNVNVIWLDQPSGVGFSYFTNDTDRDSTGKDIGENLVAFLDGFLDKHPEFSGRPLYLTGEIHAGHFIPAAASAIQKINKEEGGARRINLKGVAISNPITNMPFQYKYAADMAVNNAYNVTLLNETQIVQMRKDANKCSQLLTACTPNSDGPTGCWNTYGVCMDAMLDPFTLSGRKLSDICQKCVGEDECSSFNHSVVGAYLQSDAVQIALETIVKGRKWGGQSSYVLRSFVSSGDWARSYTSELTELLNEGIRVLLFAGDAGLLVNWIGIRELANNLDWAGKSGFNAAQDVDLLVPKDPLEFVPLKQLLVAGTVRQYKNLAFARVFNAGHFVPEDQPSTTWVMLDRFLKGEML